MAAARGDVAAARRILEQIVTDRSATADAWLKLAAMCRATGDVSGALAATHGALALSPLHFTALLLRASLLDKQGHPSAGEAYGHALAQRPAGDLPPAIAAAVARAQRASADHLNARDATLKAATAAVPLSPEEVARGARFRSNALRRTHPFHSQPTHYHYPGLREREFHDRAHFPWLEELEHATDLIAEELAGVVASERAELVPYIRYAAHEPVAQWRALNHSRNWTAIHLLQNGVRIDSNVRHCPRTMAAIDKLPLPRIGGCSPNVMFSLLAPGTMIPPHTGVANTRLVCHLPLIVPEGCWFRVGAETRTWRRGEAFVFDDTIEHEAANPTEDLRVVLILDVWHPDLSVAERDSVRLVMEADIGATLQQP